MKAKKEYLILVVIIIAAGLYLALHKKNQTQYDLPALTKIEIDAITRIQIATRDNTISLDKIDSGWQLAPHNYPADGSKIKSMLFELEAVDITDLVSESKAYKRYQLDDEKKLSIKAWAGDKLQRDFSIGKEAATYQHTFIRLPDNPNVYHARGDFRRKFELNTAELRDREVLAFDPDTLKQIRINNASEVIELTRQAAKAPAAGEESAPAKDAPPSGPAPAVWQTADGKSVDTKTLDDFLTSINNLMCSGYLEGRRKEEFKDPVFTITLEGDQPYTLALFPKTAEKDTDVPGTSSYNAYPFTLSNDRLDNFKKAVDKLAGKKEAPPKE